jgi:hypothetical protein
MCRSGCMQSPSLLASARRSSSCSSGSRDAETQLAGVRPTLERRSSLELMGYVTSVTFAVAMAFQLAAGPQIEKVWSDRALRLKLFALGLLVVGDLAWLPFLGGKVWSTVWADDLPLIAIWSAIAVLAWFSPLIAALFLFAGGVLWATLWLGLVALLFLEGWAALWTFVWWAALPIAAARFLVAAHRTRRELEQVR